MSGNRPDILSSPADDLIVGKTGCSIAVRRASVPVLIQKSKVVRRLGHVECKRVCATLFTRVLHPTDFSECANAAFQVVKRLKAASTEEVSLLHVQDERLMKHRPVDQIVAFDQEDTRRLERMQRDLLLHGMQAQVLLRHGIPFRETLRAADEVEPGLIVLGSLGRGAAREVLGGSTFENVIRLSRHPVLVVRQPPD